MNIENTPVEMGLSLGSNLGDRLENLREAVRRILAAGEANLVAKAPIYETEPVGVKPEFAHLAFLNTAIVIASSRPVQAWLPILQEIEHDMGRVRGGDRNAPRPVDVDILFAGEALIDSGGLSVPHPRWAQRRFVVQPLADVRPDLVMPDQRLAVREILARLPADGEAVHLFAEEW
jgi:2-amino-4-hydroxy-6-hydroxymethyldihydropteridine diphosphokinase